MGILMGRTSTLVAASTLFILLGCSDDSTTSANPSGACAAGQMACPTGCAFVGADVFNCGGCGVACGAGELCSSGQCACTPGLIDCGVGCLDPLATAQHCGSCENACPTGTVCSSGQCVGGCAAEQTQCGQDCADLSTSLLHCGACSHACAVGEICDGSVCAPPATSGGTGGTSGGTGGTSGGTGGTSGGTGGTSGGSGGTGGTTGGTGGISGGSGGTTGGAGGAGGTTGGSGGGGTVVYGDPFAIFYRGINLSGAEHGFDSEIREPWGDAIPGSEGAQYAWPHPDDNPEMDEVDIYLDLGTNIYRLPFQWERLQPTLGGGFDAGYLGRLRSTVDALVARGSNVILDPHNYARFKPDGTPLDSTGFLIGSAQVPISGFVDLWTRLASEFGSSSPTSPILFGLMNEPHDIDVATWVDAAQQAVNAIRAGGAQNVILVPGADWDTASDFAWSDNRNELQSVTDPNDNFAIEVHQYDQADDCNSNPNVFLELIAPLEAWARANNRRVFLGESNTSNNSACLAAYDNLLTHLEANRLGQPSGIWIGWTGWASSARGDWDEFDNDSGSPGFLAATITPHLPATCNDSSSNGDETDLDCGGHCRRCSSGSACSVGTDCQSGACAGGTCQ